MRTVNIDRTERISNSDTYDDKWKSEHCYFILTFLSSLPNGGVFAEWIPGANSINWNYSLESGLLLKPPEITGQVLVQNNVNYFRPILAALGLATVGDAYIGTGTFQLSFRGEEKHNRLYAAFISNTQELGYWIRLHILKSKTD